MVTDVSYEAFISQSVYIAPDGFVTDSDFSAYTQILEVELNQSRTNDRIKLSFCSLFNSTPYFCKIGSVFLDEYISLSILFLSIVYFRYSRNEFTCECQWVAFVEPEFAIVHFSSFHELTITQYSIRLSNQLFSHIIQSLQLLTDPSRPNSSHSISLFSIRTFDGNFYSNSAQSTIDLSFTNLPPVVSISPLFTPILEEDSTPSIAIFSPNFPPLLSDDSGFLQRVVIVLVNSPDGANEKLTYTDSQVPDSDVVGTSNSATLILEGPATTDRFISALTRVVYSNSKLSNILKFSPDLTERILTLQAVDTEGEVSLTSSLRVAFFANCKNGPNLIRVPSVYSITQLSLCERLQNDLEINGEVSSLSLLSQLRVINGSFVLREVKQLKSFVGLENVEFFQSISISNMPDLVNTSELGKNIPDTQMITVESISINGNPNLLDLSGLRHVEVVTGPVVIVQNSQLNDLSGLNGVVEVDEIYIISNLNLEDINGFMRTRSITNSVYINLNSDLLQLTGFGSLNSVGSDLIIIGNSQIESVDGLTALQSASSIVIASNNKLCYVGDQIITASIFDTINTTDVIITENSCVSRNCTSKPCLGGGDCEDLAEGGFTCACQSGLTGNRCQLENECITISPCQNNATCLDTESSYSCLCMEGYSGRQCHIDINDCDSQPCQNGGNCIDRVNSFSCQCPDKFTGSTCDTEILNCSSNSCLNGSCLESPYGYKCDCDLGYTGTDCEVDINECDYLPCVNGGTCVNTDGSFLCDCFPGFSGGLCEEDVNECLTQPCSNGSTCMNTKGSFVCLCPPDIEGPFCQRSVHPCTFIPCKQGQCEETEVSYVCQCNSGYTGQNCDVRINNCEQVACLNGAICINNLDDYSCDCLSGYSGDYCEISDPCISSPCFFGGECVATGSDFTCQCPDGLFGDRLVIV